MDSPSKEVFQHVDVPEDLAVQFTCDVWLVLFLYYELASYELNMKRHLFNVCSKNPLLDAEIVVPCGHSFCSFCIDQIKGSPARASTCQLCREPVTTYCKNRKASSMMSTVQGSCCWCKETFPLDTAKQHIRHCQELEGECAACKKSVKRGDIQHDEVCEYMETVCECGEKLMRRTVHNHKSTTCPMRETHCPLKCGVLVKR